MGRFSWSVGKAKAGSGLGAWLARVSGISMALACGDGIAPDEELSLRASTSGQWPFQDTERASGESGVTEVLAEMHIDHFTISLLATDEGAEPKVWLAAGETCSLVLPCEGRNPVTELRELYEPRVGRLTHLELFQALAPGVRPPAALLASHSLEALDAGRDDDRVRNLAPLVPRLSGSELSSLPIATVAALSVDGATYRFRAAGSGPDAMVFVTESDVSEGLNALTRLAITHGDLTLLETFLALAPDAEPPFALVATHPREIERMGTREDDAVRYDLMLPPR